MLIGARAAHASHAPIGALELHSLSRTLVALYIPTLVVTH